MAADPATDASVWQVAGRFDGEETQARVTVLGWSDIVAAQMRQGVWASYRAAVRTAWIYIGTGALFRLMRLRKGPVLAALYPVAMLAAQLGLAILLGFGLAYLGLAASEQVMVWIEGPQSVQSGFPVRLLVAIALAIWLTWRVLRGFYRSDGRFLAHYLMQDYAFAAQHRGAFPAALEARLAVFADQIEAAFAGADEVLVVGHSSGAYLAVSILSDLIAAGRVPKGAGLALLTLGHVVPMVSFLPKAGRLRRDLARLGASESLTWIDVTAPGDGCAFALCDPVAVSGVATPDKRWPLVISAAFTQTLLPETWAALRWRFFRLHFQYLCAFDRPGDYDYFAITAGPVALADRFAGRAPSPARIEKPVSGYRDQEP